MSWLARSLANSLRIDGDGNDENDVVLDPPTSSSQHQPPENALESQEEHEEETEEDEEEAQGRGVKEDLDEIKQTLTRQFWGMASFLAPPPSSSQSDPSSFIPDLPDHAVSLNEQRHLDDTAISIHSSDAEHDALRTGYHDPNSASIGSDSEGNREPDCYFERAVGITEEVLAFAMNIAMHPETWLDFPIEEEDDPEDFEMSEDQLEHAAVIERLAPRLAALRIELCPCHMSESYFWKVYFVLLHSRLNKQDAGILSTPQVMAARALWMQELQKQTKPEFGFFGRNASYSKEKTHHDDFNPGLLEDTYSDDVPHSYGYKTTTSSMMSDYETEKHTVESSGTHFIDKSVIEETPIVKTDSKDLKCGQPSQINIQDYDDDDEWPEEDSDLGGYGGTTIPIVNEEDISFSDLEDDDYGIKPGSSNKGSTVV